VEVTPLPGFVIKTYATDDDQVRHSAYQFMYIYNTLFGVVCDDVFYLRCCMIDAPQTKVFINVCESEFIAPPSIKTRLDDEGKEVEGTMPLMYRVHKPYLY
jgi:hypothetical protein